MRTVQAAIFDWGNTLVDYPLETAEEQVAWLASFLRSAARQWSAPLKKEMEALADKQEALYRFNQEMPDYRVRGFEGRLREVLPVGFSAHVASVVEQQLCRRLFASARIVEGAEDVVLKLHKQGLAVGIISNTPWGTTPNEWRGEIDRYDFIRKSCSATVFCHDVGFRKPHPAAFHSCLQKLGASPDKTIVIGDSLSSDVAGALAVGCKSLWFDRRHSGITATGQPSVTQLADTLAVIDNMNAA